MSKDSIENAMDANILGRRRITIHHESLPGSLQTSIAVIVKIPGTFIDGMSSNLGENRVCRTEQRVNRKMKGEKTYTLACDYHTGV